MCCVLLYVCAVYMVLDRLQVVWGSNFLIEVRKYPMAHALHLQVTELCLLIESNFA